MKRQRIFFKVGLGVAVLTALLHGIASMQPMPPPANDSEATLFKLLATYAMDFGGGGPRLTFERIIDGLSHSFTLLMLWVVAVGFVAVRAGGSVLTNVARINAVCFAILLAISWLHFPPPPTICIAVLVVAFAGSSFGGGKFAAAAHFDAAREG
jgi:hypothetical protein